VLDTAFLMSVHMPGMPISDDDDDPAAEAGHVDADDRAQPKEEF